MSYRNDLLMSQNNPTNLCYTLINNFRIISNFILQTSQQSLYQIDKYVCNTDHLNHFVQFIVICPTYIHILLRRQYLQYNFAINTQLRTIALIINQTQRELPLNKQSSINDTKSNWNRGYCKQNNIKLSSEDHR